MGIVFLEGGGTIFPGTVVGGAIFRGGGSFPRTKPKHCTLYDQGLRCTIIKTHIEYTDEQKIKK